MLEKGGHSQLFTEGFGRFFHYFSDLSFIGSIFERGFILGDIGFSGTNLPL